MSDDFETMMRGLAAIKQRASADRYAAAAREVEAVGATSGAAAVRVVIFGRSPDADVTIPDQYASPRHAAVTQWDNGAVTVEDLGSTNGTRLNGHRVDGRELMRPGDVLTIGRTDLPWREAGTTVTAVEVKDDAP